MAESIQSAARSQVAGFLPALLSLAMAQDVAIRTRVNLVVTPVTVTDGKGHFVDGLAESDFVLLDDGKPQSIRMDTSDIALTPISLVVAVQSSVLTGPALEKIRKVGSLVEPLITGERGEAAVLRFHDEIEVAQDFTSSATRITKAFGKLKPMGSGGRSLDAVRRAIEMLDERGADRRKIVVLVAESKDRGSKALLPDVLRAAQRANVTVYPVTYSIHEGVWTGHPEDAQPAALQFNLFFVIGELARLGKTNTTRELARFTGGQDVAFFKLRTLEEALRHIGEELHSQYLLSFAPAQRDGDTEFHSLEVKVKNRPDLVVQARPGYWPL